ncbi:MAG: GRP family sugar transporter [Thermoplasmata archaeon]
MLLIVPIIAFIIAGLLFGSQFVPQKFCKGFDTKAYNLSMIIGIALISMIIAFLSLVLPIPGNDSRIELDFSNIALCLIAGIIWCLGNFFILAAISKIGISRTFPVVNLLVVVAFFSGILFLEELHSIDYAILMILFFGIACVLIGSFFTAKSTSKEEKKKKDMKGGVITAALSAIFFGVYNVPVLASLRSETWSPYLAVFFLSMGALLGAVIFGLLWLRKKFFVLWRGAGKKWHLLAISGGMIWGIGQVFATIAMSEIGIAIGAPLLQGLVIVVGVIWGLAVFKELKDISVKQRKRAGFILLVGCTFALIGSVVFGYAAGFLY